MNTVAKTKILVGETTSGSKKYLEVYKICSDKSGPSVYIQANIHGPEIAGTPVIWKLIDFLNENLICGSVTLIPCANPWGVDAKFEGVQGGYINHNGHSFGNWNRMFPNIVKDFEKEINAFIRKNKLNSEKEKIENYQKLLLKVIKKTYKNKKTTLQLTKEQILTYNLLKLSITSDIVIDLHTAGKCLKHAYFFPHQCNSVTSFGIPLIVEIPYGHIGVFDESNIEPWNYLVKKDVIKKIPKEAYTLEFFGDGYSSLSEIEKDLEHVKSFLYSKGLVKAHLIICKTYVKASENNHYPIYSPIGGIFHSNVKIGDKVKKGCLLGVITILKSNIKVESPFDGIVYQECSNHATETGQKLVGIFSKVVDCKFSSK